MRHDIGVPQSFAAGILSGQTTAFFRKNRKKRIVSHDMLYIFPHPLQKGMKVVAVREVAFASPARIYPKGFSLYDEPPATRTRTKSLARSCGFDSWTAFRSWYEKRFKYGEKLLLIVTKPS